MRSISGQLEAGVLVDRADRIAADASSRPLDDPEWSFVRHSLLLRSGHEDSELDQPCRSVSPEAARRDLLLGLRAPSSTGATKSLASSRRSIATIGRSEA